MTQDPLDGLGSAVERNERGARAVKAGKESSCLAVTAFALIFILAPVGVPGGLRFFAYLGFLVSLVTVYRGARALFWRRNTPAGPGWPLAGISLGLAVFGLSLMLYAAGTPRPRAQMSHSMSNLKQLSVAVQAYRQDNDGHLPGWIKTADGRFAHNAWDEQISPSIRNRYRFRNGDTGIRSYSDPQRQRVLTYGLNGLLITTWKPFDGTANWKKPAPRTVEEVTDPATTILFAELATENVMPGVYGRPPEPIPTPANAAPSKEWNQAHEGWIDIDPRAFVEVNGPKDSYDDKRWDASRGVARDMYGGGANYAFVDGHVRFMKLAKTVGADQGVQAERYWAADNPHNMWNPDR